MMAGNMTLSLPSEVLERIFLLLAPSDLQAVSLVCRRWAQVATLPELWAWARVTVTAATLATMTTLLATRRFRATKLLRLRAVSEELLGVVVHLEGLLEVELYAKLAGVEATLLATLVARVPRVRMSYTQATPQQALAIFTCLSPSSKLRHLEMENIDLSMVSPEVLGSKVAVLETALLAYTSLSTTQLTALLTSIIKHTNLTHLDLTGNNLSGVGVELVAEGLGRVEAVEVEGCELTEEQASTLLTRALALARGRRPGGQE